MNIWLLLVVCGVCTFLIRLSFIAIFGQRDVPAWVQQSLRFVPAAVLFVIVFQSLFYPQDHLDISISNTRLLAGLVAVIVAWRTKNAMLTIIIGMLALVLLNAIIA